MGIMDSVSCSTTKHPAFGHNTLVKLESAIQAKNDGTNNCLVTQRQQWRFGMLQLQIQNTKMELSATESLTHLLFTPSKDKATATFSSSPPGGILDQ